MKINICTRIIPANNPRHRVRTRLCLAALCLTGASFQAKGAALSTELDLTPAAVTTLDPYSIAVLGYNTDSGFSTGLTSQLTATFGATQTYPGAGLGGQDVTVISSETIGATMTTDTFTISVPTNFDPAGTMVGGTDPVTLIEMDIGGYNAGTNPINFAGPISSPTYSGSVLYGTNSTASLNPITGAVLGGGGTTLYSREGVNAGGADLSPYNVRSFTFTVTYANPVPEPATWTMMLGALGVLALARCARRTANV